VPQNKRHLLHWFGITILLVFAATVAVVLALTGRVEVEERYRCFTQSNARLLPPITKVAEPLLSEVDGRYIVGHQTEVGPNTVFYLERGRWGEAYLMSEYRRSHNHESWGQLSVEVAPDKLTDEGNIPLSQLKVHASRSSQGKYAALPFLGSTLFPVPESNSQSSGGIKIENGTWSGVFEFDTPADARDDPNYFTGAKRRISFSCKPKPVERKDFVECAGRVWQKCHEKYWGDNQLGETQLTPSNGGGSSSVVWCPPAVSMDYFNWCLRRAKSFFEYVPGNTHP
jgi:hypothetical protein